MNREIRYETFEVSLAPGSTAGTYDTKLSVDDSYDTIVGIEAYEDRISEAVEYRIGIADNTREWINPCPKGFLLTDSSVGQSDKSRETDIPVSNNLKVRTLLEGTVPSGIRYYVVLTLHKSCGN